MKGGSFFSTWQSPQTQPGFRSEYELETPGCDAHPRFLICCRLETDKQVKGRHFWSGEVLSASPSQLHTTPGALRHAHMHNNNVGEGIHCPAVCSRSKASHKLNVRPWSLWQQPSARETAGLVHLRRDGGNALRKKLPRSRHVGSHVMEQCLWVDDSSRRQQVFTSSPRRSPRSWSGLCMFIYSEGEVFTRVP